MEPENPDRQPLSGSPAQTSGESGGLDELLGVCKGVMADSTINLAEAEYLRDWLEDRPRMLETSPARELHQLLVRVLADDVLTALEESELLVLLEELTGEHVTLILY